ncbi:CHAT domain-containing protein [Cupriavidus necator]|uniref:CHAT domain-containing protein n=1 Tax=Cupriavidus necator TaxID=106590 RepID=UPI0039C46D27
MTATTDNTIVFLVPGESVSDTSSPLTREAAPAGDAGERQEPSIRQAIRVSRDRGQAGVVEARAVAGRDVVILEMENGPELYLHPESARALLQAQQRSARNHVQGAFAVADGAVPVSGVLDWNGAPAPRGAKRGWIGNVVLKGFKILGLKEDLSTETATALARRIDEASKPGMYELARPSGNGVIPAARVEAVPAANGGGPLLVLLHGTFVDTESTFGQLWQSHAATVNALFDAYGKVYALNHPTLGTSPIANALALARTLPEDARVHLLTHSRGGIVAEVLARVSARPTLTQADLDCFKSDGYAQHLRDLKDLSAEVTRKGLRVERIVRVACPARGTLLASKRLDAYLSVLRWSMQLSGVPVLPAMLEFLEEVARQRTRPETLPGLEAQIPESPLQRWLHRVDEPIPGRLYVVAGDMEGDALGSWVKTLMSDAFFWTDNDLIVQTRSMYGGTPRAEGAGFMLDQGGKVSHFNYFRNASTVLAIQQALLQDDPPVFRPIGPLSWAGASASGARASFPGGAEVRARPDRPALFLLPGILGSHLQVKGRRIWLGWRLVNSLDRLAYTRINGEEVLPDGPIEKTYGDLIDFLSQTHEVIPFSYDWRKPIEEEARRFGAQVGKALAERQHTNQPVRCLAHSMGGLVARAMQLECPTVWAAMLAHPQARFLMLGTPNDGSWAPMQMLSGDDPFGNALTAIGAPFHDGEARQVIAGFPGFIQMQAALLDSATGLDRSSTWSALAQQDLERARALASWHSDELQINVYKWGIPAQALLEEAKRFRERLDQQLANAKGIFGDKTLLVVGASDFTPDGFELVNEGLVYVNAAETGDGRVTLNRARLPGVRTWQVRAVHGNLPSEEDAFAAYLELLEQGDTSRLPFLPAVHAGRGTVVAKGTRERSRPSREARIILPPQSEREMIVSAEEGSAAQMTGGTFRVSVINGNLSFVSAPILVGHYHSLGLLGSEKALNRLVDGRLKESMSAGLYPDAPGTHQVFLNLRRDPENPWRFPMPEAVVVVGLGDEGNLKAADFAMTVRRGVMAWSQRCLESGEEDEGGAGVARRFTIATTLMGSGGLGITVGESAQQLIHGVQQANEELAKLHWPTVEKLQIIELFLDRAAEAWRAIRVQEQVQSTPRRFQMEPLIEFREGALRRPTESGYRGADYDLISAISQIDQHRGPLVVYTLDTRRARTEIRAQAAQSNLVRELICSGSNSPDSDRRIGRTLFQLLIPVEMEPFLSGTTDMVIELDQTTAGIPWEMLDDGGSRSGSGATSMPWAIRAKLLRKLRTGTFRARVSDAGGDGHILVIGEPLCDEKKYPPLPGAADEARAVWKLLQASGEDQHDRIAALISQSDRLNSGSDALTVVNTLLERDWRIVHIAGHGEPAMADQAGGVVLSNGAFLGYREIESMRRVPDLVFVNCCHLAAPDRRGLLNPHDRTELAASVAGALINIGVRCVVAAGWAVDDEAAKTFATSFYEALLRGQRFIDAVALARTAALAHPGNTWAAYQCYGDPDWVFRPAAHPGDQREKSVESEFGWISSHASLELALETIAVQSRLDSRDLARQRERIKYLADTFGKTWGSIGKVAEAFGRAFAEASDGGDFDDAIAWYRRAADGSDASASMRSVEQLGNLLARRAWGRIAALRRRQQPRPPGMHAWSRAGAGERQAAKPVENSAGEPGAAASGKCPALKSSFAVDTTSYDAAIRDLDDAILLLTSLETIHKSQEVHNLLGSAYKRKYMVQRAWHGDDYVTDTTLQDDSLEQMQCAFGAGERLGRIGDGSGCDYAALNLVAARLVATSERDDGTLSADEIRTLTGGIRRSLVERRQSAPDFWGVAGMIELRIYEGLADGSLPSALDDIVGELQELYRRVPSRLSWASIRDHYHFFLADFARREETPLQMPARTLLLKVDALSGDVSGA